MDYYLHLRELPFLPRDIRRLPFAIEGAGIFTTLTLPAQSTLYLRSSIMWRELLNAWLIRLPEELKVPSFKSVDTLVYAGEDGHFLINFLFLDEKLKVGSLIIVEFEGLVSDRIDLQNVKFKVRILDRSMSWLNDVPAEVVYGATKLLMAEIGSVVKSM